MKKITVSIAGGSGYAGGELLRLLLFHPHVEVAQVTSDRFAGKLVTKVHPNLRSFTQLKFSALSDLCRCDMLFSALPHGSSSEHMERFKSLADKIIDLGSDFRLDNRDGFIYGIPELHREEMKNADYVSSAGCNATAAIIPLYPLYKRGVVDPERTVIDVKTGSSEGGNKPNESSHHPIRAGSIRSYKPTGHRHAREIVQELTHDREIRIYLSATAVDIVRGVLATCHVFLVENLEEKNIWKIYREEYGREPFIRIVKEREGSYRYPDPVLLAGTNFCDIGFKKDEHSNRLVVVGAIDNLVKGAAGQAVQAFNVMYGIEETTGLMFPGLHPL